MMPSRRHRRQNEQGVALLLALLLVAALTAAGIGASTLIVKEFKTTASTDQGIAAYYAADAGVERALFTVFNNRIA
ncbi:MAG: hypothetical protein HY420_03080, partial [Candidatus Kerfeldbacteria bacterium]|nr:hypothetical protein [Candidatus Kerfeldbacteria bacterium]